MVIFSNIFAIENVFSNFLSNLERVLNKILVEWLEVFLLVVLTNVFLPLLWSSVSKSAATYVKRLFSSIFWPFFGFL